MATYEQVRKDHLLKSNSRQALFFATKRYDPNKETIIMLPGGLASQLERSKNKYNTTPQNYEKYENVWIDLGIIFKKEAKKLEINDKGRDKGDHIVIPNGPLESFAENPYDETKKYFRDNDFNYYSWGYDWRRPITESAELLKDFLSKFKQEVIKKFGKGRDPLPNTTILCHSMGGLVTKLFLNNVFNKNTTTKDVRKWMRRVITVATPFYGTGNHIHRYYRGQDPLNIIYGKKNICKLAGTMPGAYILMFLDQDSYTAYKRDIIKPELLRFPTRDMKDPDNIEVDPYDLNSMSYYPTWIKEDYISLSKNIRKKIIQDLPSSVIRDVYHIRADGKTTNVELKWKNINRIFNPKKDKLPLVGTRGKGDGTVPFWSARLAITPDTQIYNTRIADNHSTLMEHIEVLRAVESIINKNKIPKYVRFSKDEVKKTQLATKKAVNQFLNGVASNQFGIESKKAIDPKIWRRILNDVQ